jgi:hypothetical protein
MRVLWNFQSVYVCGSKIPFSGAYQYKVRVEIAKCFMYNRYNCFALLSEVCSFTDGVIWAVISYTVSVLASACIKCIVLVF